MLHEGTTALVTGGSGGIGSVVVRRLAKHGVTVIALSNDPAKLAQLNGVDRVETLNLDVTDDTAMRAAFSERSIDILIKRRACSVSPGRCSICRRSPPNAFSTSISWARTTP